MLKFQINDANFVIVIYEMKNNDSSNTSQLHFEYQRILLSKNEIKNAINVLF